jgi:hypothetical protein
MELAIEILNKEIERREILLAVENNVLIQNDMYNEIGGLKYAVKKLTTPVVVGQSEQLKLMVFELANKLAIAGYGNEAVSMHRICNRI